MTAKGRGSEWQKNLLRFQKLNCRGNSLYLREGEKAVALRGRGFGIAGESEHFGKVINPHQVVGLLGTVIGNGNPGFPVFGT